MVSENMEEKRIKGHFSSLQVENVSMIDFLVKCSFVRITHTSERKCYQMLRIVLHLVMTYN